LEDFREGFFTSSEETASEFIVAQLSA